MIVEYRTKKLKKQCEDPKIAKKDYGSSIGNKLTQRVEELIAATSLLDIQTRNAFWEANSLLIKLFKEGGLMGFT